MVIKEDKDIGKEKDCWNQACEPDFKEFNDLNEDIKKKGLKHYESK